VLLTACGSLAGTSGRETSTSTTTATTTTTTTTTTSPPPATPQYSVIGRSTKRYDGQPIYYVLIDPVNLGNDAFKQDVKLVLQAVAKTKGDPDFSARIFDDEAVAKETFSHDTNPPPLEDPDEIRAATDRRGQHLVAIYSGGLKTLLYPYEIDWYPAAFTDTPNVGQYVDTEQWKPHV
jgi:hypothetical protein